jgi:hypothetical protein
LRIVCSKMIAARGVLSYPGSTLRFSWICSRGQTLQLQSGGGGDSAHWPPAVPYCSAQQP